MANQKPDYVAYTIVETNEDNKDYWQRVGSAWTNKDGSINITLKRAAVERQVAHPCTESRRGIGQQVAASGRLQSGASSSCLMMYCVLR